MADTKISDEEFLQAAASGDAKLIEAALASGADADTADAYGNTALMMACARGQLEVCKLLLNAGAQAGHQNKFGLGPRQWLNWADDAKIRNLLG